MEAFLFIPCLFLAGLSVSSTQISQPSFYKVEENKKPILILERKNEANYPGKLRESIQQGGSYAQGKPSMFNLQGQPGSSNQPEELGSFHQQGRPEDLSQSGLPGSWILQGNLEESNLKGSPEASNKQAKLESSSQLEKLESTNQQGMIGSSSQGKPGSSSEHGKPGSSSQHGKPGSSSQHGKPGSFYPQGERKNSEKTLNGKTMEIQTGSTSHKKLMRNKGCHSAYKPVCGSDGKSYDNDCVFSEAKRLSHGTLSLKHEGKC